MREEPELVKLSGIPVDVHVLADFLPEIDPYQIKTVMRLRVFRKIEDLKRVQKETAIKFNWKTILIIAAIGIILVGGIIAVMYGPQIMEAMKGFMGGITGGK